MEVRDHGAIFVSLHIPDEWWTVVLGSPWGAGTVSGDDNLRHPSDLELEIARIQGKSFAEVLARITL
jgi:multimeric flavodoxin WrbA